MDHLIEVVLLSLKTLPGSINIFLFSSITAHPVGLLGLPAKFRPKKIDLLLPVNLIPLKDLIAISIQLQINADLVNLVYLV